MILRQLLHNGRTPLMLARSIVTDTLRPAGTPFPPIVQRAADTAVKIVQDYTSTGSTPPPSSIPPTDATPSTSEPPSWPKQPIAHSRPSTFVMPKEDPVLELATNMIMKSGQRGRARKVVTETLLYIHSQTHADPLPFFKEALQRASPSIRMVKSKQGPKNIGIPFPMQERQRLAAGLRWILEHAGKTRTERGLHRKIAWEMFDIMNGTGHVLQLKQQLHKEATLNRSLAVIKRD